MCLPDIFSVITKLRDVVYTIYLLIFLNTLEFIHFIYKSFVFSSLKSLALFSSRFFFINNFTLTLCFSRFWQFAFLFFSRGSRSRQWIWLIRFYHFASFHNLLFYQHFRKKMYIFLLIFVASVSNIKSHHSYSPYRNILEKPLGKCINKPAHFF